ncbi:glycoside hydrolase family 108 protein [Paraburkholderia atlantica]|uniref:glycoside hydrolase family 108 protein n=1 Tax=Paraburkholderia atlantica TaxID=2654982 RepID=UPI003D216758
MPGFDDAFTALIGNEGGYSNNPSDPGGETMWGITARVARAYGYVGAMRDLPLDTAKSIAKKLYWDPLRLDSFDPRVAFQIFDANYNGGHPVIWMQGAAGAKVDGLIGPQTITAVQATDPLRFLMRWNALRLTYYTSLKTWATFGKGWANRIANNLTKGAA